MLWGMEGTVAQRAKLTTRQIAAAIRANVDRLYAETPKGVKPSDEVWARFDAEQRRLWNYAAGRSERFVDAVARLVSPPLDSFRFVRTFAGPRGERVTIPED
jgi:hypothetical protein